MFINRRAFLTILGVSPLVLEQLMLKEAIGKEIKNYLNISPLLPSKLDKLDLHEDLKAQILLRDLDEISKDLNFGANCDYLQFFPLNKNNDHGVMWVNHEDVTPIIQTSLERNKLNVDRERKMVGGSLVELKKIKNEWVVVKNSKYNRRLDATTMIPFDWKEPIAGKKEAEGTLGNCAGGKTPWGTVLTCEENFDMFYSDNLAKPSWHSWEKYYNNPLEHYGWVVEVNPFTGEAKKHPSLGRMAHECATYNPFSKNKAVFYTGDDANDEHLYKFVSDAKDNITEGTLYVAHLDSKTWIPLTLENPKLKNEFKNITDLLINTRKAAKIVGATPLDRPEDIEVDTQTGDVLISLTNNKAHERYHGKILRLREKLNNPEAINFEFDEFLIGGDGFSCPDNMAFDPKGNLWFTTDIAGSSMHKEPYEKFGNNSLFVVLKTGEQAGIPIRVASAPNDAEFTGPLFSPDGKTLFLCVQHPGETTKFAGEWASTWPDGGKPKSCVLALSGPLLDILMKG